MPQRVLIVDDEEPIRFAIGDFLETHGHSVVAVADGAAALEAFRRNRPDVVLVDYRLEDCTALDLLPQFQALDDGVPVIVLTAHASIDLAVRAIKEGAEHFLTKPVELPALLVVIERVSEHRRNRRHQLVRAALGARHVVDPFTGTSPGIRELADLAARVATSHVNLLIQGETGTGKGVLARWLHQQGERAEEPFVDVNCAGLSPELLDSELFGHERGAFTSAIKDKPGLLEVAHGGSLFLDEIGDMSLPVQGKLLKVLEERHFRRLGGVRDRVVDIRLLAATHHDLQAGICDGTFRRDLYYRINTIQLVVPPLRARREDIPLLARVILRGLAQDLARGDVQLDSAAEPALCAHSWPGNVRELRNVLERALLLSDGATLGAADLRFEGRATPPTPLPGTGGTLRELEIRYIEEVIRAHQGQVPAAAAQLGIPKSSLYQKLKTYGIDPSRFRTTVSEIHKEQSA
jgi:DNA-binding NtrC family response regulator